MATRTKRAATQIPDLPPELWDHIFDFATYVPYTLVPEIFEKSTFIGPCYNQQYHPKLRAALVTKRYLVRVCRRWWHIAIRHLYRAIYIGRARCLSSLCATLQKYAIGKGTVAGAEPLGRWTQRLDVVIRDHLTRADTEADYYLADIIKCLPNIAIVSFAMTFIPGNVLPTPLFGIVDALRYSASSIRILDWTTPAKPAVSELVELLKSLPRLHTFHCPYLSWGNEKFPTSILSSVNTLALTFGPPLAEIDAENTSISLRKIILDTRWDVGLWEEFMDIYGTFLTSIHFDCNNFTRNLTDYLDMVNRQCPNLLQMTICVEEFSSISFVDSPLPSVGYLGLMSQKFQETRSGYRKLFSSLAILNAVVPTLRVVQLLDCHNVQCLLTRHSRVVTRALEHELAGSNFRIVDHEGNLLSDSLPVMQKA
ncbi:hypothetical protein F5J12DRAFT_891610 [Pisolithus orientalis]|uniref:uncharacterized protein n=1 Tax=Pisolithus orientalis TaxID=936130 RepID=UPI002224FAEC|nr:uncharacterized protein F5J12DRAFT_891610 [Pisolithus orientalis]KAI6009510.1 hypothetical protein F5J12DRAFT_891610 [Pisolithus orientalis]